MNYKNNSFKTIGIAIICAFTLSIAAIALTYFIKNNNEQVVEIPIPKSKIEDKTNLAIIPKSNDKKNLNYNKLASDKKLKQAMQDRKKKFGLSQSLDLIVKPDETIKVGENTITVQEIMEKIRLKDGDLVEKDITTGVINPKKGESYGIYVVKPGDNIWNIHFNLLRDYFKKKGIKIASMSDEPNRKGYSSGYGKLLKFSEKKVYIYNVETKKLEKNINILEPKSKIVVYNMNKVFALLDWIDVNDINNIGFDGETIWIKADK